MCLSLIPKSRKYTRGATMGKEPGVWHMRLDKYFIETFMNLQCNTYYVGFSLCTILERMVTYLYMCIFMYKSIITCRTAYVLSSLPTLLCCRLIFGFDYCISKDLNVKALSPSST